MKKLLSFILTCILCLCVACPIASAAATMKLSVDDYTVGKGDEVCVPITLENNPGIWGIIFSVHFDTDVLEVSEVRNNGDVFTSGEEVIGPADFTQGRINFVCTYTSLTKNNTANGTISTIYFKVLDTAKAGKSEIKITYDTKDVCDIDAQTIELNTENGSVTVKENFSATTAENQDKTAGEVIATTTPASSRQAVQTTTATDKNGNVITNSDDNNATTSGANGNDTTDKQVVTVTDSNGNAVTESADANEAKISSDDTKTQEPNENSNLIWYILGGVVVLAICGGIAFFIIKKKKSETK